MNNIEIERKYLLHSSPLEKFTEGELKWKYINQGYIPGTNIIERVRRVTSGGSEYKHFRTIKMGHGIQRIEVEEETTFEIFNVLWRLTVGKRVQKYRYEIPDNNLIWEIDLFSDRELMLAEVELTNVDEKVIFPPWLAHHVEREVTDDPSYSNWNLAK